MEAYPQRWHDMATNILSTRMTALGNAINLGQTQPVQCSGPQIFKAPFASANSMLAMYQQEQHQIQRQQTAGHGRP